MLEFWEIGSRLQWRRGPEGDLQIAIWEDENGLAPLAMGCAASTCYLWKKLLCGYGYHSGLVTRSCLLRPVVLDAARRVRAAPVVKMG